MLTYTFGEFMDNVDTDEGGAELYVIRKGKKVLYVGKTSRGIGNRWFGWNRHMCQNFEGDWFGNSLVGREIARNLPASKDWEIDMYTVEECREIIKPKYVNINIDIAEQALIRKLKPKLNVAFGALFR